MSKSRSIFGGAALVLLGTVIGAIVAALIFRTQVTVPVAESASSVIESIRVGNPEYEYPASAGQAASLNTAFNDVAQLVRPAVVSIHAGSQPPSGAFPGGLDRPFGGSTGSGVIISDAGYVVTNNHVVAEARDLWVVLTDKREFEATVIGTDPTTDLAVIKLEDVSDLSVIALGDSDQLKVGDWVIAIGNPFRLTSTVTAGIVSAMGRQVQIIDDVFSIEDFIQTDAAINPGNSGGALVTLDGRLVGINTAIATKDGTYQGYGFAVPVNLMAHVVSDLIAYGHVKRAYLGISMEEVTAARAADLELPEIVGVLVRDVVEGGAAARSGIREDDVILSVDGYDVRASNELQSRIATSRPGDKVLIEVWRDNQTIELEIELVDRDDEAIRKWQARLRADGEAEPDLPLEEPEVLEASEWGVGFRALSPEDKISFGTPEGAYVGYVVSGSIADDDGLPRDVVVTEIDGQPVRSPEDALVYLDLAMAQERPSVLVRAERRDGLAAFYELSTPALD